MASYYDHFMPLDFSEIRHHQTKEILAEGDIVAGDEYCGIVHIQNINWGHSSNVYKATANLYLAPVAETNLIAKKTGVTDSRVMMEGLSFWEKFEKFKLRACDEKGYRRPDFNVAKESELFFGFARKNNIWYSTSVTLNSWIKPLNGKDASDAVRNAGIKCSYRSADLTNLMPKDLWHQVLPRLDTLTPYHGQPWTVGWATAARSGLNEIDAEEFAKEELDRIRCLVFKVGIGSKLYDLDLSSKCIGRGGLSTARALATVLLEEMEMVPRCADLQRLNLGADELTDEQIVILAPAFAMCRNLEILNLNRNRIGDRGCSALSRYLPPKLEELDLSDNKIGDEGCKDLVEYLPRSVSHLDLRHNMIGREGCNESVNMCERSQREGNLLLSGNPGYSEGSHFLSGNPGDETSSFLARESSSCAYCIVL